MHTHLKAWRDFRGLTQEQVANHLGIVHTTVGRYESGNVTLSAKQIEKITGLFGITVAQLSSPPGEANMVNTLQELHTIVQDMEPAALQHWIALGHSLKRAK